jgi:hypothetical protein
LNSHTHRFSLTQFGRERFFSDCGSTRPSQVFFNFLSRQSIYAP